MPLAIRMASLLAALAALALASAATPARADACTTNMIPAYFAPGATSPWEQVIASTAPRTTMIVNPASGPGDSPDPAYQETIRRAQAAGVRVLGYVHTSWGARKSARVRAEVDRYASWYDVDGIFFDEAATSAAQLSYYRTLYRHVKTTSGGGQVVLNHGTVPDERYMEVSDVAVLFEGSAAAYSTAPSAAWRHAYGPDRFADLVYAAPPESLSQIMATAEARGVGHLYATDDVLDNPWDTLPSYYDSERDALTESCAAA